jgi:hypothetical protein
MAMGRTSGNGNGRIGAGSLILGTESNHVRDVKESLQTAQTNSQDFIVIPLVCSTQPFSTPPSPSHLSKVPPKKPTGPYCKLSRIDHEIGYGSRELHLDRECCWENF